MAIHHKRRRRRKPEEVEEVTAAPSHGVHIKRQRTPTPVEQPKQEGYPVDKKLRPIWQVANELFKVHSDFGLHTHKVYPQYRGLFCIANVNHIYTQFGDDGVVVSETPGLEVVQQWLDGTKNVRKKDVQVLRNELQRHVDYAHGN